MKIEFRKMENLDIEQVQTLIPNVFADLFARETGRPHYLPKRTRSEMESYMHKDPDGSIVAVTERGKIVGCVFCHRWGEIGWLGPMVVDPAFQGRGIGSHLLEMAIDHMTGTQCRVIGLETMPQTVENIRLYLRHGFFPENLRIRLWKDIHAEGTDHSESLQHCLDLNEAKPYMKDVARISRLVDPCIDYSQEVYSTFRYELGRCFFWREGGNTSGFMLYHWIPASSRVVVKAMACEPGPHSIELFKTFLNHVELVLAREGIRQLILPVYGDHHRALDVLVRHDFRIQHAGVRMFYRKGESDDVSKIVHLAQWSG